ncbi:MAG: ADP-ribosylglycohydrolase family protein [Myxococcales bacterium]|nr:ADP-ribosylglycohydrolase family protein [Myxococcales bacterium]
MQPIERALLSLQGLSVGDALGERFFGEASSFLPALLERRVPEGTWSYTDDTEMALSIVESLLEDGGIEADALAQRFAARYNHRRGYGGGAHILLAQLKEGRPWQEVTPFMFGGQGSFGNGTAMRIPPLGAYFAEDLQAVCEHARRSALPTHAHPEATAGAIATAVMAALAWRVGEGETAAPQDLLEEVIRHTPESLVKERLQETLAFQHAHQSSDVAKAVGAGERVSCQDTVPFCLWNAAYHLENYEEAFWTTVSCLGDRDTTCAIVGGIVVLADRSGIPALWQQRREPLPPDIFDIKYAADPRP